MLTRTVDYRRRLFSLTEEETLENMKSIEHAILFRHADSLSDFTPKQLYRLVSTFGQ